MPVEYSIIANLVSQAKLSSPRDEQHVLNAGLGLALPEPMLHPQASGQTLSGPRYLGLIRLSDGNLVGLHVACSPLTAEVAHACNLLLINETTEKRASSHRTL